MIVVDQQWQNFLALNDAISPCGCYRFTTTVIGSGVGKMGSCLLHGSMFVLAWLKIVIKYNGGVAQKTGVNAIELDI